MKIGFLQNKYNSFFSAGIIGWIITLVGSLANGIIAGMVVSQDAVSAVLLVSPVYYIIVFCCVFVMVGSSTLFVRFAGKFNKEEMAKVAGMGMLLAVIIGILMMGLVYGFEDLFFRFYSSSPGIEALARDYYKVFPFIGFIYPIYFTLYYLVASDGDPSVCLASDCTISVALVIFPFMLGKKFGISGIAYGELLSYILAFLVVFVHFFKKTNSISFKLSFNFQQLKEMFKLGSLASLTYLFNAVVDLLINKETIVLFGDEYLPVVTVIAFAMSFNGCLTCSIDAASPFISLCYGEKNPVGIKKIMHYVFRYNYVLGVALCIVFEILAPVIPGLYSITDPELVRIAVNAVRIVAGSYIFYSLQYSLAYYYVRIDKLMLSNIMGCTLSIVGPMGFCLPLAELLGINGISLGFALCPILSTICGYIYVCLRYGKSQFPLIPIQSDAKIYTYELVIDPQEIISLQDVVGRDLELEGTDSTIINKIQLFIEETFMLVKEKNPNTKVLADCTIMVYEDRIQMITRDNGIIFNITDSNVKIDSFRGYVIARLMDFGQTNENLTTTSFNRNSYIWQK